MTVWNGRNVNILGSSQPSVVDLQKSHPSSNFDEANKPSDVKSVDKSKDATANPVVAAPSSTTPSAPSAAPVPTKSVWNGRHEKIIVKSDATKPSTNPVPPTATTTTTASSTATIKSDASMKSFKKKKGDDTNNIVVSSTIPKDEPQSSRQGKEDEGTNSTAGSSTANTLDEDTTTTNTEENNVANTTVVVSTSPSNTSSVSSGTNTNNSSSSSEVAPPTLPSPPVASTKKTKEQQQQTKKSSPPADVSASAVVGGTNKPKSSSSEEHKKKNNHGGNNKSSSGNANKNGGGGVSSNHKEKKGGGKGNNYHGNNKGSNKQHKRGSNSENNNGGNGRRKANSDKVDNRQPCSFFAKGMCNRGDACTFKHDPSAVTAAPSSTGNNGKGKKNKNNSGAAKAAVPKKSITPHPAVPPLSRFGSGRVFDPLKARAIQLAKDAQDKEDRSFYASSYDKSIIVKASEEEKKEQVEADDTPFFSIDVECIATGYGSCARGINDGCGNEGKSGNAPSSQYNDRSCRYPGRVAMVDSDGNVVVDVVIRPPQDGKGVVSYLTPLTGLTAEMCLGPDSKSLEEAVKALKAALPKNGVLVGQAVDHDIEWLGLTEGKDFERMVDISVIFRQRMPGILGQASDALRTAEETGEPIGVMDADQSSDEYLGFATRYRSFSLRHVCLNLLSTDIQSGVHDPVIDAKYSLILFHKYRNSSVTKLRIVRDGLHRAPVTPGFATEKTPVIDGVCLSAAGYPYKRAARKVWRWYSGLKGKQQS